jgi:hypothetical protein
VNWPLGGIEGQVDLLQPLLGELAHFRPQSELAFNQVVPSE